MSELKLIKPSKKEIWNERKYGDIMDDDMDDDIFLAEPEEGSDQWFFDLWQVKGGDFFQEGYCQPEVLKNKELKKLAEQADKAYEKFLEEVEKLTEYGEKHALTW